MSKRRLSTQQKRRIQHLQQQRAERATSSHKEEPRNDQLGPEQTGLVIAHFGAGVRVEPIERESNQDSYFCHLRANLQSLVAGDRVIWRRGEPRGVVVARLERDTELQRPDRRGRLRTVAANIDRIMLVVAPQPKPHANLVNRYLVVAAHAGIDVSIVVNKTDLDAEAGWGWLPEFESIYPSLGYSMLRASTQLRDGLEDLERALAGQTTVFVGQSGVGKSSLINSLLPGENIETAPLSTGRHKGRHTTTTARLYHLPAGGALIDSPGIREFALVHLQQSDLARGFVEMRPWLGRCQFRDCQHVNEPGCAITDAVTRGEICAQRHASYCWILNDNKSH